jgi:phage-related tail fiber protein
MSQHDFTIANQTASSARSDINNALQSLVTNNSGASAPSTPYANMWWYDSSNNKLYIRNENNTAWIEVANLDQGANRFEPVNAVPVGAVNPFAMNVAPTGWLACDGSTVSRTTYSGLFTVVGTTYGSGDGSTTFKVPDLRGEFVRGWDDGRGADTGRTFGSAQGDAIRNIEGTLVASKPQAATGAFTVIGGQGGGADGGQSTAGKYTFDASTVVPTADENRPRNVALLYCIKF